MNSRAPRHARRLTLVGGTAVRVARTTSLF
jgi:hypothetical protein